MGNESDTDTRYDMILSDHKVRYDLKVVRYDSYLSHVDSKRILRVFEGDLDPLHPDLLSVVRKRDAREQQQQHVHRIHHIDAHFVGNPWDVMASQLQ